LVKSRVVNTRHNTRASFSVPQVLFDPHARITIAVQTRPQRRKRELFPGWIVHDPALVRIRARIGSTARKATQEVETALVERFSGKETPKSEIPVT
jgi:hypothetical protein